MNSRRKPDKDRYKDPNHEAAVLKPYVKNCHSASTRGDPLTSNSVFTEYIVETPKQKKAPQKKGPAGRTNEQNKSPRRKNHIRGTDQQDTTTPERKLRLSPRHTGTVFNFCLPWDRLQDERIQRTFDKAKLDEFIDKIGVNYPANVDDLMGPLAAMINAVCILPFSKAIYTGTCSVRQVY